MKETDPSVFNDTKMKDYGADIIIYPSSWYYNACVQGF